METDSPQITAQKLIRHHRLWRLLEIIPGAITWLALILPIILSIFFPVVAASFIIIYTIIWLFRSMKLSINLYRSFLLVKQATITDWEKWITLNDSPEKIDYELKKLEEKPTKENLRCIKEYENLKKRIHFLKNKNQYKKSKEMIHAIICVTYKESFELVRESIKSYTLSQYSTSRIILIFAGEDADRENFLKISGKLKTEFGEKFMDFLITIHPKNIPGEIKGKSANATFAAKELKKWLDSRKINYGNVIVSNFDADTVTHPFYFTELTYKYLTTRDRTKMAYQPTHMFHNNIWDVPMLVRMVALSCTFWRMAESMEQDKYKSFSSRSLSFQTVIDVNYWDPAVIPEDSRQYWTAYAIYNGEHRLIPIYSPIYMDAVLSDTYTGTFKNQYNQLRRWAWGVCDFPFVVINLWKHTKISWSTKIYQIFEFLKNSFFWATGPILLMFMGYIPGLVNADFRGTVIAYNLPQVMSNILTLTSSGLIICTVISLTIIPYNPKKGWLGQLSLVIQWFFVPVVSIFLSAVPALDAQTRLMFGKYLEYKVTEKARK